MRFGPAVLFVALLACHPDDDTSTPTTTPEDTGTTPTTPVTTPEPDPTTPLATITVTEAPTVTQPTVAAPLSRLLHVCTDLATDAVLHVDDGEEPFDVHSLAPATCHDLRVLGLEPDHTYALTLTLTFSAEGATPLEVAAPAVATEPVPSPFPVFALAPLDGTRTEPGIRFVPVHGDRDYVLGLDSDAEVVWLLLDYDTSDLDLLPNGDLLLQDGQVLIEVDLLGNEVQRWVTADGPPASGVPVETESFSHEAAWGDAGTIYSFEHTLVTQPDYPLDYYDPTLRAEQTVTDNTLVEFDQVTGAIVWSLQVGELLDRTRIGFNSLDPEEGGRDWGHGNAFQLLDGGNAFLVSLRHQDAVLKVERTGAIDWIFAPDANWPPELRSLLLTPTGKPFVQSYHQHAPEWDPATGSLLVFDNGDGRASPFTKDVELTDTEAWSRLVEFHVDEAAGTISQTWTFDELLGQRVFSKAKGDIDRLPTTGNVLGTYADVQYVDGVPVEDLGRQSPSIRIVELAFSPAAEEVFDLELYAPVGAAEGPWHGYRTEFATAPFPR